LTAIKTEGLSKRFGNVIALDNLDLEVPENVVFGFLGPNGAGKTTTVKLLTGFTRASSGSAIVAGEKVTLDSVRLRSLIGLLPDVPAFYDWMTGKEFLSFVAEIYQLSREEAKKRTGELLEMAELEKAQNRRIGGYSRGMRQRLGIAQALVNQPKVLFMDEPTSALDPIGRREVLGLIQQLRQTTTIFMSTHILSDVERVCDMVGIIDNGKLIITSTVKALRQKYAHSVFELEFLEDAHPVLETLHNIEWLAEPEIVIDHDTPFVRVRALDTEYARRELPKIIANSGLTVTRYEMTAPSLEDIFIEIVNEEESR
jgi:ABC-2 type transport system ATP-binding protein